MLISCPFGNIFLLEWSGALEEGLVMREGFKNALLTSDNAADSGALLIHRFIEP